MIVRHEVNSFSCVMDGELYEKARALGVRFETVWRLKSGAMYCVGLVACPRGWEGGLRWGECPRPERFDGSDDE